MSAINYYDEEERCPNCGGEDITPHINFGNGPDEQGRLVSEDGWKCHDCDERWMGLSPYEPEKDVYLITLRVAINPVEHDNPSAWRWDNLIDCLPEDVSVVECKVER